MADNILIQNESADLYSKIVKLITSRKTTVSKAINVTMVTLYWEIGEAICHDVGQRSYDFHPDSDLRLCGQEDDASCDRTYSVHKPYNYLASGYLHVS